jgi:hypothetical protein
MQAINTPTITKTETSNRTEWTIGSHRVSLILTVAGWQVIATNGGRVLSYDLDILETQEEAGEVAEVWVEAAIENETEWEDE